MISLPIITALALLPFVLAQSTDTAVQIEAIEAHFTGAGIVPSLLSTFVPSALLNVSFDGVDVSPGEALTKDQVAPAPTVTVTPANSSVSLTGNFTITMVDADVAGHDDSAGVNRHWLVNGVTVSNSDVSNTSATAITQYAGPGPAAGSGPHRYVIILYAQPSTFSPPSDLSQTVAGVESFDLNAYVKDSGLGSIIAATYFTVEVGTSSVSVSSTAAVISSTLASITSATGTGSSGSGSATGSSGNAASTQSANAALGSKGFTAPFAMVFAALAVLVIA